jgi:hypothetical protein
MSKDDGVWVDKPFWRIFPNTWEGWKERDKVKKLTARAAFEGAVVLSILGIVWSLILAALGWKILLTIVGYLYLLYLLKLLKRA